MTAETKHLFVSLKSFQFIILVLNAGNSPSSSDQRLPIEIMGINWEGGEREMSGHERGKRKRSHGSGWGGWLGKERRGAKRALLKPKTREQESWFCSAGRGAAVREGGSLWSYRCALTWVRPDCGSVQPLYRRTSCVSTSAKTTCKDMPLVTEPKQHSHSRRIKVRAH